MGLYRFFENKWYDLVEKIDEYLPVTKIVDRVDKIVPSFILVLLLILFILVIGLMFFFSQVSTNEMELVVLSSSGMPLGEVSVIAKDNCDKEYETLTDESGKIMMSPCSESLEVTAEKVGYEKYFGTVTMVEGKASIRLDPVILKLSSKNVHIEIIDLSGTIIDGANLELICLNDNNKTYFNSQNPNGFNFSLSTKCNPAQLKATATGYQEKTVSLNQTDERLIITLQEVETLGKVLFRTITSQGIETGTEITFTNIDTSLSETIFTDYEGYKLAEIKEGDYSYVAVSSKGHVVQGNFSIQANQSKDVEIEFPIPVDTSDYLIVRVVSISDSPLSSAKVDLYKDGNFLMSRNTDANGEILPIPITPQNLNSKYIAIVSLTGYESSISPLTVRKLSAGPYEIKLRQGGAKLKVNVVDDVNSPQKNTAVLLRSITHKINLYAKVTDSNGNVVFSELPAGDYSLRAVDSSGKAEATLSTSLSKDSTKNVQIVVVTGEGKIKFKFLNSDYGSENPTLKVFELNNGSSNLIVDATAKAGAYETSFLKAGTKIFVEINDENFIPTKSSVYEVTRKKQDKEIYLVRADKLPNNNSVQVLFIQAYSSNPLYGTPTKATQILAGSSYYLQFLTIVNNENDSWLVSDFYVGPKDKNILDINQVATIGGIYSIDESINLLSSEKIGLVIDPLSSMLVNSGAKQGNSQLSSLQGKFVVPVILKVDVDVNKIGDVDVFFRALHGNDISLLYKKSFTIGQRFCLTDCPMFLFSSYIKQGLGEYTPLSDTPSILLVGDDYNLKVVTQNLSDTDFGSVNLLLTVPKESIENMLFVDKNVFSANISLLPLGNASVQTALIPIKAGSASEKIIQTVEKISGGVNLFRNYAGNNNTIRFSVKAKEQLEIAVSPVSIDEKVSYPMFLVKTKYKGKKPVSAHWNAKKIGVDGTPLVQIANGTTDVNGVQILSFDATSLSKGDKVRFTAYDDNGALDGFLDVVVSSSVPQTIPPIYECLTPKMNNVNLFDDPNYYFRTAKGGTATITVDSNCDEDRLVHVHTDLTLSEVRVNIPAKSSKTITLTANPRDELLGVYPVQILTLDSSRYTQLALTDVEIFDDSCFQLSQAVFDMQASNEVNAKVTNKCFSGRKDNFYPKMDISTKSVGLTYNKPGNPEKITFTATVVGHAVEYVLTGFGWGTTFMQKGGNSCPPHVFPLAAPSELLLLEEYGPVCQEVADSFSESEPTPKEEPDIPATDPAIPFYSLPPTVQRKVISEIFPQSGSTSLVQGQDVNLSAQNTPRMGKLFFAEVGAGETINEDDTIVYYPGPAGDIEAEASGCTVEQIMPWVAAPRPPEFGSCEVGECWTGITETPGGKATILSAGDHCDSKKIIGLGLGEESIIGKIHSRGDCDTALWIKTCFWGEGRCTVEIQPEFYRVLTFKSEVKNIWTKDFNLSTIEGSVQNLGSYSEATPTPRWTDLEEAFGHAAGDTWTEGDLTYALMCVQGMGFGPPEGGTAESGNYELPDPASPLVEYDSSGTIAYEIPSGSIPADTRAFLKNGRYYVEYFGAPQVNSPDINFTLTKSNLLGSEYAILTVQDWTGGNTKSVKQFQVKLKGAPSSCYTADGIAGVTGSEFRPRVLFNWDWNGINADSCDMKNENYIYCDATQFTLSLFKRLPELQNLIVTGRTTELATKTAFYAYLIKDNYPAGFLEDFDKYYSGDVLNAPSYFNTTSTTQGYDQFISRNKLSFIEKNSNTTQIPYGGLYRVEINIEFINQALFSLFDNNVPNANIKVVLTPIQTAPNYNPFYETPFDGEVGKMQDTFIRKNYGVSVNGGELKLNSNITTHNYSGGLKSIPYSTSTNLQALKNAPILYYEKNGDLEFNPSQPTPVLMAITGTGGNVSAQYNISGTGFDTSPRQDWKLISSTINSGGKCADFENNNKTIFTESDIGGGKKTISWKGTKAGTITLATTFLTPKGVAQTLRITPSGTSPIVFSSYPNLKNSNIVMLNNYDAKGEMNYDTLEGLFKLLEEEKVCLSQNSEEILRIWWNPEYINKIQKEVNANRSYSCN